MSDRNEFASIPCRILDERPLALRVEQNGNQVWIPRSPCKRIHKKAEHPAGGRVGTIEMPWWLADEKGLEEQ